MNHPAQLETSAPLTHTHYGREYRCFSSGKCWFCQRIVKPETKGDIVALAPVTNHLPEVDTETGEVFQATLDETTAEVVTTVSGSLFGIDIPEMPLQEMKAYVLKEKAKQQRRLEAVGDVGNEWEEHPEMVRFLKSKTPAFDCPMNFAALHQPGDLYPAPLSDVFEDDEGEPLDFIPGEDIAAMAAHVFRDHETLFGRVMKFRLQFRWRAKGGKDHGAARLGRCQKTARLIRHFSGADFVIMLSADHCRAYQLTFKQVEALVFHELCHLDANGDKPSIDGHDFEGFVDELRFYGAWKNDLKAMETAVLQPSLFDQLEGATDGE